MVSPRRTTTAPCACLAIFPVSRRRVCWPTCDSTWHACTELSSWGRGVAGSVIGVCVGQAVPDSCRRQAQPDLLAEAQTADQRQVTGAVGGLEIGEQAVPLADHLEQAAPAGVIFLVDLEVL